MSDCMAANNDKIEPKCPRCGDLFYHPKSIIEDQKQRAVEWEYIAQSLKAELNQLKKDYFFLKNPAASKYEE